MTGSLGSSPLLLESLWCFVRYLCYIIPCAGALIVVRLMFKLPRELFRKMLHAAAFTSAPVIMWLSSSWQVSVVVLLSFGVVVWPLLAAVERFPWYADLFVERHLHEVRRSLLILFWGNAALVGACWGLCERRDVAIAAILMWGFGDAAAALVGKRWGRHRTGLPLADPSKTWEGSFAMFAVSLLVGVCALGMFAHLSLVRAIVCAAATSLVGAYVELVTTGGNDTITVPTANAVVLLLLMCLLGW